LSASLARSPFVGTAVREHAKDLERSIDDVECRMPTQREFEQSQLDPGVPVVRVPRTVYDSDGVAVEVQDTVAAADKHLLRYEVTMR
jgi:GntR family transcriptional regulator